MRDITLAPIPNPATASEGRTFIAAIGIDVYRHWQSLQNAVRDATGILELFQQLGFTQITAPLFNDDATGSAIRALVTDELTEVRAEDSLVLFYAGHGATRSHHFGDRVIKSGYLVPVNGEPDKVATWMNLDGHGDQNRCPYRHASPGSSSRTAHNARRHHSIAIT